MNDYYKFVKENFPEQYNRMQKWGRRNISISTCAPTGSVSLMTQTSSGIEPLFQPYYIRRKKINPNDPETRCDFMDINGDKWQEYPVLHPKFKEWLKYYLIDGLEIKEGLLNGYKISTFDVDNSLLEDLVKYISKEKLQQFFEKSPWYGSTANDINWLKRIEIQGVIQSYISHSISSTINLPENVSVEEVGKIYFEAWKKGLKGVTIYRDNSRSGVLINKKEETPFKDNSAPKRPKTLPCKIIKFQNNHEKWISFIGLYENKPYEIFTGLAEAFEIPINIEEGFIHKIKLEDNKKRYDFSYGENSVKNLSKAFRKEYWNYAKLISSLLRHGMPLPYLVNTIEDMTFDKDHINTWKSGVIRALKKFISNNTISDKKCLDCGNESLIYEEGCLKCTSCGSSRC